MPQMMPCSWLIIFFMSMMVFLVMNCCWSNFFVIFYFPYKEISLSEESETWF